MNRYLSLAMIVSGVALLLLGLGFLLQLSWVTWVWPWTIANPLSYTFLASICAAIAAPIIWIGLKRETAAMAGGAINLFVTGAAMAVFCFQLYAADNSRQGILIFAIVSAVFALTCIWLFWTSYKLPFVDEKPMPTMVRFSFAFFALALLLTGGALVLKTPNIFPWNLTEELRVMYGWIFLGAMCYFIYAVYKPKWSNAQGQLLGFLAYDLVLIVPFLLHFRDVAPEHVLSLIIYIGVLLYSGALAVWFLFINKETRFGSVANTA
jgi:hypothetical protein